jgi:hypothetical protein
MFGNGFPAFQQTQEDFWSVDANLAEEQKLWQQPTSDVSSNAFANSNALMTQQTPRSLPASNMTYPPVWIPLWCTLSF